MSEIVDRVSFETQRYCIEEHVNGTFFIQDGYTEQVVRENLTAADEPIDIVNEMNARAAIGAMREPTPAMVAAVPYDIYEPDFAHNWRVMIDKALKE